MRRQYDPSDDSWYPLTEGDYVDYNMAMDRYRIKTVEFDGDYFRRQETAIRFAHDPWGGAI